ncbi:MAG: hypothetical protein ACXADW_16910 [Candidatus Hodarchaeales archaeon]
MLNSLEHRSLRWKWNNSELSMYDYPIYDEIRIELRLLPLGHHAVKDVPKIIQGLVIDTEVINLSKNMNGGGPSGHEKYSATNRGKSLATSYKKISYSYNYVSHQSFPEYTFVEVQWFIRLFDLPLGFQVLRTIWEIFGIIREILIEMFFGNLSPSTILGVLIGGFWSRRAYLKNKGLFELNVKFFSPLIIIVIVSYYIIENLVFVFIP